MQNPSGGAQAQRSGKGGFWARGSVKQHRGGRKHNYGSRNNNAPWSSMGPRSSRRPPNNHERFPPPTLKDPGWGDACNAGYGAPRTRGQPGFNARSRCTAPSGAIFERGASSIQPRAINQRLNVPQAHKSDRYLAPPAPSLTFPKPFPYKNSLVPSPRPTLPNNYQDAPPAPRIFPSKPNPVPSPRPMPPNNMTTPTSEPTECVPPEKTQPAPNIPPLSLNSSLPTFDLQAQDLVMQCLLSRRGQREVDEVVADVHRVAQAFLPDNVPVLYGSMATGLALETSDIDCYIDSKRVSDRRERVQLLLQNYKSFYRRGVFQEVHRIPHARVPLLKAVHGKTGIEIDISCTSDSALYNTQLIKFLVQTDVRIRPLIVLVSLCCRLNGLAGTNRFVSYTIVLLVLFYLQNLEVPLLPPLYKILSYVQDDPWPRNFTADVGSHLRAQNQSNLAELFSGFFKFYHSFDFSSNVVSTFLGHAVPVDCFSTPGELPDELSQLEKYFSEDPERRNNFLHKLICVQDPMEHFINITSYVQLKTLDHFKAVISYMVKIINSNPETSWLENMLKMTEEIKVLEAKTGYLRPNPDVQINVSYPKGEALSEDEWLLQLKEDLLAVFKLLLFDAVEVTKEPEAKVRIAKGPVHNRALMVFELKSCFNVFTKRFKGLTERVIKDPSLFQTAEKEMLRISEQMKKPASTFHCELTVRQPVSPDEIPVNLQDINENASNTFLHLSGMLKDNLTELLASAMKFKTRKEDPKEQNEAVVVEKTLRDSGSRYVISYDKEENEDEEAWMNRFRVDLISLFEFLLIEHKEVTSTSEKTEFLEEGESVLFAFELQTPFNIFTKRFKNLHNQAIDDPSSVPTIKSELTNLSSGVNTLTVGTFHGEFLLIRSDCLPPGRMFAKMYDINKNLRNNFNHYSSNLQLNISCLVDAIKKFREMQISAD